MAGRSAPASSAASARPVVARLRPAGSHSTVCPAETRQPPTAAPISPGCSSPTVAMPVPHLLVGASQPVLPVGRNQPVLPVGRSQPAARWRYSVHYCAGSRSCTAGYRAVQSTRYPAGRVGSERRSSTRARERLVSKFVYDFTEGNKDLKDLLGGKGANLAEMTNLGLPVPPGFTITTDACRYYLSHGTTPDGPRRADGPQARRSRGSAPGQRPVRGKVLHAGHDGDRPQHRPVRRVGPRPGEAGGQRAVRPGLLPAPHPDVRQDRARHRG